MISEVIRSFSTALSRCVPCQTLDSIGLPVSQPGIIVNDSVIVVDIFSGVPVYSFPGLSGGTQLNVIEGSDAKVQFDVTRDPPLLKNKKHKLSKEGDQVLEDRITIGESAIQFSSIRREDAGIYTITSSNGIGEGHGSFTLNIFGNFFLVIIISSYDILFCQVFQCIPSLACREELTLMSVKAVILKCNFVCLVIHHY